MIFDQETYELIENYLQGRLKGQQLREFEHRFIHDDAFAETVKRQKELKQDLEAYARRRDLRNLLDEFHEDVNIHDIRQTIFTTLKKKSRVRTLLYSIPAAACVSALVVFGVLFSLGLLKTQKQSEKELLGLKEELIEGIKERSSENPASPEEHRKTQGSIYSGTAFLISDNGYFVTSKHVVENAEWISVEVKTDTFMRYYVKPAYISHEHDLVVLKATDSLFTAPGRIPFAVPKEGLQMGEYVYTLGYPRKEIVFNEGSISSSSGYLGDTTSYQVSIPVNKGNSGGPLLDEKGNLIGIVNARHAEAHGATFAVKTKYLHEMLEKIQSDSSITNPPVIPQNNRLQWQKRPQQIEKMRPFIYRIRAYKKHTS